MRIFRQIFKGITLKATLLLAIVFLLLQNSTTNASYQEFLENLNLMDITVDNLLEQDSISRYELTRLLNAVECTDCIQEPQWMFEDYNNDFWSSFVKLPGKYFDDISYLGGMFEDSSYYYCVAYVGDKEYMRGYPEAVSPVCAGQFCGQRNVTKAEFVQVLVNLLAQYIHHDYLAPRDNMNEWMNNLEENSSAAGYLDDNDRITINEQSELCLNESCQITNVPAFKTYLKYCMYNLDACDMVEFGIAVEGYRPVAELNILYQQDVMDAQEAREGDINLPINGQKTIALLHKIHEFVGCSFNDDYDCDGLRNAGDNCPNAYNPHQTDTDGDGVGDVCDDDIDGDGVLNPIGIVDDLGHINISVAYKDMDNCLFVQNPGQEIDSEKFIGNACSDLENKVAIYIQVNKIGGSIPLEIELTAVTKGSVNNIEWNFGDGSLGNGRTVNHTYNLPGTYTISATAFGPNNEGLAKTTVIAGKTNKQNIGLIVNSNKIGGNKGSEFTFSSLNVGDIDSINWEISDGSEISREPGQSFSKVFTTPGHYVVKAKAIKNNQIVAVGITNIAVGIGNKGVKLTSNKIIPSMNQEVTFDTDFYGFTTNKISTIHWDFGDGTSVINTDYTMEHSYEDEGKKAVVQIIKLKDGTQFINILTIYVTDSSLTKSHSLTFKPNKLWIRKGQDLAFEIISEGDKIDDPLLLSYQYMPGVTTRVFAPQNFPITSDSFKYSLSNSYNPKGNITIDACRILESQATIIVHGMDSCLESLLMGELGNFHCDMDEDGIPDICDNDIDGDGVENLIGMITHENEDCSIGDDNLMKDENGFNVDLFLLNKHIDGVCSLDNCPFVVNADQFDLNGDNIGDLCLESINGMNDHAGQIWDPINNERVNNDGDIIDTDNDGIPDSFDVCPELPETYNGIEDIDGCPEIGIESMCPNTVAYNLCGNGIINAGEHCSICPEDVGTCISVCGNGIIEAGENCHNCPEDVPECGICGNGIQESDENCETCPEDYGDCTGECGDGNYDYPETCQTCPDDVDLCEQPDEGCGNGVIDDGEHCSTCPEDVGACTSTCGNLIIEAGENCHNCPEDVPECGICGNGIQEPDENCETCPEDYGDCTGECGDGNYDYPETCQTCPDDVDLCESPGSDCEDIICPGPCNACPCQYTDFISDLTVGDLVKAVLWDWDKLWIYSFSNSEEV